MTTSKPKKVWVDKFHPNNARLTLQRVRKMPDEDIAAWIKVGNDEIERYKVNNEFFDQFRGYGPPVPMSMLVWCIEKVDMLQRTLDRHKKLKGESAHDTG